MNKSKFFIAIGPPKTGTTWLYANLLNHPEVFLPRDKELRYFWVRQFLGMTNIWSSLFNKHWHFQGKRRKFISALKQHARQLLRGQRIDLKDLKWDIRYFCGTQNDAWYERLFPTQLVSGDITPKYCELSEDSINSIKTLIPECKVIISLRDPIEREWSRVKMNLLKHKGREGVAQVVDDEIWRHISDKQQHEANDYTALLERWQKFFPAENIFVFYFEELQRDPQNLFNRICDFLKIAHQHVPDIDKKRNKGIREGIPSRILDQLLKLNYPFMVKFSKKHPNEFVDHWVSKYKQHDAVSR
jgi:hypothetical protein